MQETSEHTRRNKLSNDPTQIHIRRETPAQSNGTHLRRIRRRHSLKNTPGDATEDLPNKERREVLGEEQHEDEPRKGERCTSHCASVAQALGEKARDNQAEDFPNVRAIAETRLPGCGEFVAGEFNGSAASCCGGVYRGAVIAHEGREGEE
jgi:hypothetical protein